MEFEQYLEKDIITFLEGKIERKDNVSVDREEEYGIYLTRDYLKELSYALDNDELTRAKKLFDELKNNFSKLPKNSIERKKIYTLLEKMYDKIQNYVKIKDGKIEVIKQGDSEVFKDKTQKFSTVAEKFMAETNNVSSQPSEGLEPAKIEELPIGLDKNKNPKKKGSGDAETSSHKKHDRNNVSAESNIITSTTTSPYQEENPEDKKNLETEKKDELIYQNVFVRDDEKKARQIKEKSGEKHDESDDIPQKVIIRGSYGIEEAHQKGKYVELDEFKHDTLSNTAEQLNKLNKLKVLVTEKLLDELCTKLEENDAEQDKKIESLRREIIRHIAEELDKRFSAEKDAKADNIDDLKKEIRDGIYLKAQHIISSDDNKDESDKLDRYLQGDKDKSYPSAEDGSDRTGFPEGTEYFRKVRYISSDRSESMQSHEELNQMYEEAIYTMFQNNYEEAAKMFQGILRVRPGNKAARIRLQECREAMGNA